MRKLILELGCRAFEAKEIPFVRGRPLGSTCFVFSVSLQVSFGGFPLTHCAHPRNLVGPAKTFSTGGFEVSAIAATGCSSARPKKKSGRETTISL